MELCLIAPIYKTYNTNNKIKKMSKNKYVLGVMTCQKLMHYAQDQYNKYLEDIPKYSNIIYVKFIGDPNIDTEYIYHRESNLLVLKCEDDYINLPHKVFLFLKTVRKLFPEALGVIKADDDVEINLSKLIELINRKT